MNKLKEELEQQKIKVIWNDVCEQIKKDTIEQILNLECLKEENESGWKGNSFDNTGTGNKSVRNQLRKEIKDEINNLLKKHETIQNKK